MTPRCMSPVWPDSADLYFEIDRLGYDVVRSQRRASSALARSISAVMITKGILPIWGARSLRFLSMSKRELRNRDQRALR
jgi:hypothetical protein